MNRRNIGSVARQSTAASDAKLIALGAALEEIQKRLGPVRAEHERLGHEVHNYAYGKTGYEPHQKNPQTDLCDQYWAASEQMGERNGFHACDKKLNELHHELDPVMRSIVSMPAASIAGLRVKVLAAIEANETLWDETPRDLDWDRRANRSLIEAVCAVVELPAPKETPDAIDDDSEADAHAHAHAHAHVAPGSAALN